MMASAASRPTCCPATATARRRARGAAGRAVLLQRPRRPGGHDRPGRAAPQAALERGIPYFGICFGNQLFGRALGFGTYKLTYGHRGINQPVMDRTTGKVEVTAHNHGFAVDAPARPGAPATPYGEATVSHVCLNDDVVEGLELRDADGRLKAFSVQYHPEAAAGPHDAAYLFDRFVDLMGGDRSDAQARRTSSSVLVIGSRADRHRPGLRVRLLRHPGVPGAAGRGHPGRPGELQPGDDHDRPGVRRRDVRRADHAGVRRAGDRQGAPRRAARDPRRPDRAQLRDGAGRAAACSRSTASS